jgi:hypothetical protein
MGDVAVKQPGRVARLAAIGLLASNLLGGCAGGAYSSQSSRIGPDDGTDSCHRYRVALDATGNYFAEDIIKGAALGALAGGLAGGLFGGSTKAALIGAGTGAVLGGAAGYWSALQQQSSDLSVLNTRVYGDLWHENQQIGQTQQAFDALMDCRFQQAQQIQTAYNTKQIDRPTAVAQMAVVKQRAQQDLVIAKRIDGQIGDRSQQFEVAADKVQPGSATAVAAAAPTTRSAVVRRAAPLKVTPDPASADIGTLKPQESVQVSTGRNGYALVRTPDGTRGYTPLDTFKAGAAPPPVTETASTAAAPPAGGDVRTLAGSNAARRDAFAQSVGVSEQAVNNGFEIAG